MFMLGASPPVPGVSAFYVLIFHPFFLLLFRLSRCFIPSFSRIPLLYHTVRFASRHLYNPCEIAMIQVQHRKGDTLMNFDPVSMPKVELHCHLDGSLSKEFLMQTLQLSTLDMHTIQAPANCQSLAEYLTCFDLPVSALQEKEHIRDAVVDVVRQAAAENVRYMEIRFAPMLSVNSHLDLENVVQAAVYGCQKAFDRYGVFTNLILCAMRHHSPQQNHLVVRCAREFLGNGVCALDLAGDEAGHPNEEFEALFEEARRMEVPVTIHSGECGSARNVALALQYGARGSDMALQPSMILLCWKPVATHTSVLSFVQPRISRQKQRLNWTRIHSMRFWILDCLQQSTPTIVP